jgi:uncharacterized protein
VVVLALLAVGLVVGFAAGLIGIGGGVLIVPFLYFFYAHELGGFALPETMHAAIAHATSLFVIVGTAAKGSYSYHKVRLIEWRVAVPVGIASMLGGVLGARLAIVLPGSLLKLSFGVFLILSAVHLLAQRTATEEKPISTSLLRTTITGILVGTLSGLMGVGGGILALPLLMYLLHVSLTRAAATSLAVVGFAAISGAVTYAVSGADIAARPPHSFGYIDLGAGLPLLLGSLISVHWGTLVNRRIGVRVLRSIFAAVFMVMGLYFIWQNAAAIL